MTSHAALENLKQRLVSLQGSPNPSHQERENVWDGNHRPHYENLPSANSTWANSTISANAKIRSRDSPYQPGEDDEDVSSHGRGRSGGSVNESADEEGHGNNVQLLQSKLKVSEALYEEVLAENEKLQREKKQLQEERSSLSKLLEQAKDWEEVSRPQGGGSKRELDIMQAQLKLTCQEIITLRKTVAAKDEQLNRLKKSAAREAGALVATAQQAVLTSRDTLEHNAKIESENHELRHVSHLTQSALKEEKRELEGRLVEAHRSLDAAIAAKAQAESDCGEMRRVADQLADELLELKEGMDSRLAGKVSEELAAARTQFAGERERWQAERQTLEEEVLILKRAVVEGEARMLEIEKEREDVEAALADARRQGVEERNAAKATLQSARDHITQLSHDKGAVEEQLRRMQARAVTAEREGEEARGRAAGAEARVKRVLEETTRKVNTTLQEVRDKAEEAHKTSQKQMRRLQRRLEQRDLEIEHLREVWRELLVAHPDLDRAADAAVVEVRELQAEKKLLQEQVEELRESGEGLVMMVAMQHLRLLIAKWRQPMFRERFRLQHAAALRSELLAEQQQQATEDVTASLQPQDAADMAAAMLMSMQHSNSQHQHQQHQHQHQQQQQQLLQRHGAALLASPRPTHKSPHGAGAVRAPLQTLPTAPHSRSAPGSPPLSLARQPPSTPDSYTLLHAPLSPQPLPVQSLPLQPHPIRFPEPRPSPLPTAALPPSPPRPSAAVSASFVVADSSSPPYRAPGPALTRQRSNSAGAVSPSQLSPRADATPRRSPPGGALQWLQAARGGGEGGEGSGVGGGRSVTPPGRARAALHTFGAQAGGTGREFRKLP